jgi:zinc protease
VKRAACALLCLLGLVACARAAPLVPTLPLTRTPDAPFRSQAPPPDSSFSAHVVEPDVEYRILSNGFAVIVVRRRDTPLLAAAVVCRRAGSAGSGGLGHLTAEMLLEGTVTDTGQVERKLSLGSRTAFATVLRDAAIIQINTLQHRALQTVELLARTVRRPAFDPGAFGSVRLSLANAAAAQTTSLVHHVFQTAREGLFGADSSFALPPLGTSQGMLAMQPSWAEGYYRGRYRPDEGALIVVGDVTATTLFEEAERWFGDWPTPTKAAADRAPPDFAPLEAERQIHAFNTGGQMARVWLIGTGPAANAQDFPAFSAAVGILAGSARARATRLLRFHDAKSYGASGWVTPAAHYSEMVVQFSVRAEDLEESLNGILGELRLLQKEPPSKVELESALALAEAETAARLATVSSTLSLLGEAWERRRSLTPEDVQRSAAAWLQPSRVQLVVGVDSRYDPVLGKFGNVKWYRFDLK